MHARISLLTAATAAILLAGGCPPPAPVLQEQKLDLAECIERHHANADLIEHLWIHCDLDAHLRRAGRPPLKVGLDGLLIYRPPKELVLKGDSLRGNEVLLGSNNREFWMWMAQEDTLYRGTWERLGQEGTAAMAVPPGEVFWMLGVYPIRGEVILSYTRDDRYRYLRFHDVAGPGHLRVLRELVFDRIDHWKQGEKTWPALEKDRVVAVRTWAPDGTPMIEAKAAEYRCVTTGGQEVFLPTRLTIEAISEGVRLEVRLFEHELAEALTHEVKDGYFNPPAESPGRWTVLLDEGGRRVPNE